MALINIRVVRSEHRPTPTDVSAAQTPVDGTLGPGDASPVASEDSAVESTVMEGASAAEPSSVFEGSVGQVVERAYEALYPPGSFPWYVRSPWNGVVTAFLGILSLIAIAGRSRRCRVPFRSRWRSPARWSRCSRLTGCARSSIFAPRCGMRVSIGSWRRGRVCGMCWRWGCLS